jgi:hypothetical protein
LKVSCKECKSAKVIDQEIRLSLGQENKDILIKTVCVIRFVLMFWS